MKTSKFTEIQICAILKEQEAGVKVAEICRKHGISQATFYKWRSKHSGMDASREPKHKSVASRFSDIRKEEQA